MKKYVILVNQNNIQDVITELERLGYASEVEWNNKMIEDGKFDCIYTYPIAGVYEIHYHRISPTLLKRYELTTLEELKAIS